MKSADVVFTVPGVAPAGMPSDFPLKGFRIVPILAATATVADVLAAYSGLIVRVSRSSNARAISGMTPVGIDDDVRVAGPDWIRSPGFNMLNLQGGQVGVTYRVWWAEDCYEVIDPGTSPMLPGFVGPAASSGAASATVIGPGGAATQTQNSAANIPTLATDGVAIPVGAKGAYVDVETVVGQTLSAGGLLVWWRYSAASGRWRELTLQESYVNGRRDAGGLEQALSGYPGDRLYVEARSLPTSAAGALTVRLSVF